MTSWPQVASILTISTFQFPAGCFRNTVVAVQVRSEDFGLPSLSLTVQRDKKSATSSA
jgi:hypothetical protein